jgi:NCS1 family nucleobase:cation symporter-1
MIHTLERVLGALLLAVFVVVSFYGFGHAASGPAIGPFAGTFGAFVLTVSVTSARGLGWAMYSSDYSRYLPADTSAWRIFGAATGGTVAAGAWIGVLGAALGTVAAVSDPTTLVSQQLPHTLGTITLIFLLGSTLASTVLDLYSGAMAALVAGIAIPRWVSVVVVTGCGTIAAWLAGQTDFASSFQNFLLLMSYWLAPWTAVTLVALFWRDRGRVDLALLYDRTHKFGRGLPAVLLGVLAAVPFMNQSLYTGPLASAHPALGGIGHMVGFAVAGLAYALMTASSARAAR